MTRVTALAGKLGSLARGREGAATAGEGEELRLARQTIEEKNRRLKRLKQRLEEKGRELERLRAQQARSAAREVGSSLETSPVFFVVGRAKSGTSWVMKILDSHPEILCKGEGRFFGRDFYQEGFEEGKIQPSSLYRALLEAGYLEAWIERSVWTRGDDVEEHLTNLTYLATGYFLAQRLARSGKKIVGDKTPLLTDTVVEEIGTIYPEARVIHVIRDGRDAAISLVHHRWNHARDEGGIYELKPEELAKRAAYREDPDRLIKTEGIFPEGTLGNLAADWRHRTGKTMRDGRSLLGANYTEVRYEELLENPEEEVRRLLGFLRADAGEEVVKECVEAASFGRLSGGRERGEEDSASFYRKGVAGDWRNVLTERDRRDFKEAAGEFLIELGYEKDLDW